MKSKFISVFNKKKSETFQAPKALKKRLNSLAPNGYKYELLEGTTDQYVLRRKENDDETSFLIRIKFPLEFEGITIDNIHDLVEMMYRTQKSFELDASLQNEPPTFIKLGNGGAKRQTLIPEPFPKENPIEITIGNTTINVPVKRVPYARLNEIKIISEKDQLINIELILNEETNKIRFVAQINEDILKTLDDYFLYRDSIKEFYTEGINFFGISNLPDERQIEIFKNKDSFFYALKAIQEALSKKFDYPRVISREDLFNTKILYESFVNYRMIAMSKNSKVTFSFEREKYFETNQNLKKGDRIGVVVPPNEKEFDLFGVHFGLLENRVYRDIIFQQIQEENNVIKLLFDLPNENSYCILYMLKNQRISDEELFELSNSAIKIDEIDFSKASSM